MVTECAYSILNLRDSGCKYCNGFDITCEKYMTLHEYEEYLDHLENCVDKEGSNGNKIGRLESLEDGGGLK